MFKKIIGLVIPTVPVFSARPADSSFANAKTHHAIILTIALSDDISPRCCLLFISLWSCNLLFLMKFNLKEYGYETFIIASKVGFIYTLFRLPVPLYSSGSSLFIIFKWLVQKDFNIISASFQHHFSIISKFVCCGFYMKKNVAFTLISFALLKWKCNLCYQLRYRFNCF